MREKSPNSKPLVPPAPEPFYYDKILRDRGLMPDSNRAPDPGPAPRNFKTRDPQGRVIRALSGIMKKGNTFKGMF